MGSFSFRSRAMLMGTWVVVTPGAAGIAAFAVDRVVAAFREAEAMEPLGPVWGALPALLTPLRPSAVRAVRCIDDVGVLVVSTARLALLVLRFDGDAAAEEQALPSFAVATVVVVLLLLL